ncbi:TetR/AcrR family transcriptional regulator [Myxococcaceae bacterium GXIMD 01537]
MRPRLPPSRPAVPPLPEEPARVRRTQQERRETTRRKLLESTIETLVEVGYARVTTIEVARRAGLSQGALFTHFATKSELLGESVEYLFPKLIEDYRVRFDTLPAGGDRVAAAVELLWEMYQRPELQAAIELYVAARTDEDLRDTLSRVEGPHREALHRVAREMFPEAAVGHPDFSAAIELALDAVQGAMVGGVARPDDPAHRRMLDMLTRVLRTVFAQNARRA